MARLDEDFRGVDFRLTGLPDNDFEHCSFINCNLAGLVLSEVQFLDCEFHQCDLANVQVRETGLKSIQFTDSQLVGVAFDMCSPLLFQVNFERCVLDHSIFHQMKLEHTSFRRCRLDGVDFTEAQLKGANFENAALEGAQFEGADLRSANFSEAKHLAIDPNTVKLKGARFDQEGMLALLSKFGVKLV